MLIGNKKISSSRSNIEGNYELLDGEEFYKISNFDQMDPFLMSIVSGSDHWMYISSNGGLTAGRKNPDNALFPYYTDDIIHDSSEKTGSKTILKIGKEDNIYLWEPLSNFYKGIYKIERNIYKNIPGNKIVFEEINHDLGVSFSYSWLSSEKYGFIKKSIITNKNSSDITVEYLDGIQNILPFGVYQQFQTELSTLLDGYKKNELIDNLGVGIYTLSSIPSDKAEPSESLKATIVWSTGIKAEKYLLSSRQINKFRFDASIENETDIKAARGAYFISGTLALKASASTEWIISADINKDSASLSELIEFLNNSDEVLNKVHEDIEKGTTGLINIVAKSDGLQLTNNKLGTSRHFANVLFNVMRGGYFDTSYIIDTKDFKLFTKATNTLVLERQKEFLESLDEKIDSSVLFNKVKNIRDNEFLKLYLEYLPLTFSRRHGDPSRPWNRFSIDIKDEENKKVLNYQGNWRDIFQNWEALAESFPRYIESMITKFLNGSSADGYNPYRVLRSGFEWEAPEPDMPWSNIGYWGDHQIIYLLKLLAFSYKHNPLKLESLINEELFTYINVPYRIRDYEALLSNPYNTIDFDDNLHQKIEKRESEFGSDAKYLTNEDGSLYQVTLTEKLLSTLLSKLSNFIPGGGIWMNTQRPEWNDANNALVGNGVSMVTLYYMRRYVAFLIEFYSNVETESSKISIEIYNLFTEIFDVFVTHSDLLKSIISDNSRKEILDGLGTAGSKYRQKIYSSGFSAEKIELGKKSLIEFLEITQKFIEHTIDLNRREDGLYHSYNLMTVVDKSEIKITHLYEMLEGQVAVLSSEYLKTSEVITLLIALRKSSLYREDQNSYILYPNRELSLFQNKNTISKESFKSSTLMQKLIELKNTDLVVKDVKGEIHFNGDIRNSNILKSKLNSLKEKSELNISQEDMSLILDIYEKVFNHKYFTGRSGTFYKYEGLGSIYWHMVSKLVLAVQETFYTLQKENVSSAELQKLKNFYYEIKNGLGVEKSPEIYGAFPTDPYSHTPSFSGVQQPGMTGQVKEDVISRFGELGVIVNNGEIHFNPSLIEAKEFLPNPNRFEYYDVYENKLTIDLPSNSMAFTYCQIPIVFSISSEEKLLVYYKNSYTEEVNSLRLDKQKSEDVFTRNGKIIKVEVKLKL